MPYIARKKQYKKYPKKAAFAPRVKRVLYSIQEKKHNTAAGTAQDITNLWTVNALHCSTTAAGTDTVGSGIVQGAGFNERVGERIRLNTLRVMLWLLPKSGAVIPDIGMTCRIIIVQDRMPDFGYPSITEVLTNDQIHAPYNLTKRDRFKILKDFVHQQVATISNGAAVAGGGPQSLTELTFYPKCEIEYTGTTGVTASVFKNGFFIFTICSGNNCTTMQRFVQLEYTDM